MTSSTTTTTQTRAHLVGIAAGCLVGLSLFLGCSLELSQELVRPVPAHQVTR